MPIGSLRQLLTIICTSSRAHWEIESRKRNDEEVRLFLRPWDEEMSKIIEYRLFVPPTDQSRFRISAVSQYSWHKSLPASLEIRQTVERGFSGAHGMMDDIVEITNGAKKADDLRKLGFTFDIVVKADGRVQLVEINLFGAMSETESCLFHWIKDEKQLYGLRSDVEARLLV